MREPPKSTRPLRCILFDLDGTLVDSHADIAAALDAALARHGYGGITPEKVAGFVGDGARMLVERALAARGGPASATPEVLATYLEEYRQRHLDHTVLYPGVAETLEALAARGVRCACVTNKPYEFSVSLLAHLGVATYFDAVVGGDSLPERKPAPEPLLAALAACGAEPGEAAMVGDGEPDIRASRAAGTLSVGVTYGFRDAIVLREAGAEVLISSFPEVASLCDEGGCR